MLLFVAVRCPPPFTLNNGSFTHDGMENESVFRYQTTVYYTCNENYTLIGTSNLTCRADGFWSAKTPECVIAGTFSFVVDMSIPRYIVYEFRPSQD